MAEEQPEQSTGTDLILAAQLNRARPHSVTVPRADAEWELPAGSARVYHGSGHQGIQRPVLLADGFNSGPTDFDLLYAGLDGGGYPLLTSLRERGHAVVLIGFDERSASLLENARAVTAAILRTIAERLGDAPLTVGGFSMGGLITRYVLAKLETEGVDHQTALSFSYDTPHRGAVIPVALQAFAHFIPGRENAFARQMNSAAARQLLWRHYDPELGTAQQAPERKEFLAALDAVGGWPRRPRTIAVANGSGDGVGNGVPAGENALSVRRIFPGTVLRTQDEGEGVVVAELKRRLPPAQRQVTTDGLPPLDGAPGGTLDSFAILGDALTRSGGQVTVDHPTVCFVPTVSALAVRELDRTDDLYAPVSDLPPEEFEVDEYQVSSSDTPHTAITRELCEFLLERLPA
ncbi:lipase family alpha/beta hydrolase [Streptomyces otsuchiensis]|uniref:lipase family alpha/beta hydrolase n=1 Tax=Streptomyces otsuchiensis TaxID=2681388 RepID=UPI00102FDF1A|nr:thioesterase domain-containing protein [Streptomyces otsuchiensis]